jgi:xylulokinase
MFLSDVFTESFVNATGVPVELHDSDGSVGAAKGAGIGSRYYASPKDAFVHATPLATVEPSNVDLYNGLYDKWKKCLLQNTTEA